jgi:hypothetical protein
LHFIHENIIANYSTETNEGVHFPVERIEFFDQHWRLYVITSKLRLV